jgi:hypothetical protein
MQGPNIFCFDLQLFIFLLFILVLSLCDIGLMPVPTSEVLLYSGALDCF